MSDNLMNLPGITVTGSVSPRYVPPTSPVPSGGREPARAASGAAGRDAIGRALEFSTPVTVTLAGKTVEATAGQLALDQPHMLGEDFVALSPNDRLLKLQDILVQDKGTGGLVFDLGNVPKATENMLKRFEAREQQFSDTALTAGLTLARSLDPEALLQGNKVVVSPEAWRGASAEDQIKYRNMVQFRETSAQGGSIGDRLSRLSDDAWVNLALGVGTIGFQAVSMMMQMKMRDDFLKMQLSENRRGREHEMDMLMARLGSQERVASTTGGGGGVQRTVGTTFR